jgi:hypothetical protein
MAQPAGPPRLGGLRAGRGPPVAGGPAWGGWFLDRPDSGRFSRKLRSWGGGIAGAGGVGGVS